jgi:hypothetical protein
MNQDDTEMINKPTSKALPSSTGSVERVKLSPEELDTMMPKGEQVHTFMQGGFTLIGADWDRSSILKTAKENGAELSGEQATAMKHGAVTWTEDGSPVFIETLRPSPGTAGRNLNHARKR